MSQKNCRMFLKGVKLSSICFNNDVKMLSTFRDTASQNSVVWKWFSVPVFNRSSKMSWNMENVLEAFLMSLKLSFVCLNYEIKMLSIFEIQVKFLNCEFTLHSFWVLFRVITRKWAKIWKHVFGTFWRDFNYLSFAWITRSKVEYFLKYWFFSNCEIRY